MKDKAKTKEQLIGELGQVRQLVAKLEAAETERKRAEEALRESEEFTSNLLSSSPNPILVINSDTSIRYVNPALENLTGFTSTELIGRKAPYPWWRKEELKRTEEQLEETMRFGVKQIEKLFQKKNGERFWVEITSISTRREGEAKYYLVSWVDITGRKQTEEELKIRAQMLDNASDSIFVRDFDGNFSYVNEAACELLGYKKTQLLEMDIRDIVTPESTKSIEPHLKKLLKTGEITYESDSLHKDKSVIPVEVHSRIIKQGNLQVILSVVRDITERKQTEEQLQESEEKYRSLFENMLDGFAYCKILVDENNKPVDFVYLEVNDAFERLTGLKKEDVVGKKVTEAIPEIKESHPELFDIYGKVALTGEPTKFNICFEPLAIWLTISVYSPQKGFFVAVFENITERQRAEEELKARAQMLDNASDSIFMRDFDGNLLYVNEAACRSLGYTKEELLGMNVFNIVVPEDAKYIKPRIKKLQETGEIIYESASLSKDKSATPAEVHSRIIKRGNQELILSIVRDITERKQAEKEKEELEQKTRVNNRLATVGQLASGIAHEINNPLTGVIGFSQLLQQKDAPENIRKDIRIIHDSAQRVASIVKRLLVFARQQKPEREEISVNETITSTIAMRAYEMETSNINLTMQLSPDLPRTMADGGQLQQVFLNLILNAETEMKAAHDKGNLLITTEAIDNIIRISFKDDGPGIPKENLERIFDPFFTTREVGEGTGLGLSICHGIVNEHGGRIYAESKPGKGATIIVELPIVTEAKELKTDEPAIVEAENEIEQKILVVDDELIIRQFLSETLTEKGHEVECVDNAGDALEKIKANRHRLILLDVKMPGMSGIQLYEHLQKTAQPLASRVVFITGDVMGEDTWRFFRKTKAPYLMKPFSEEQLLEGINHILTQ
jgi:PAS domain S-box-containing protein